MTFTCKNLRVKDCISHCGIYWSVWAVLCCETINKSVKTFNTWLFLHDHFLLNVAGCGTNGCATHTTPHTHPFRVCVCVWCVCGKEKRVDLKVTPGQLSPTCKKLRVRA